MIAHDLGRYEGSEAALQTLIGQLDENQRDQAYLVAQAYAWTGQIDPAFEWLEKAYALDERYGMQGYWFHRIMLLPIWRNLHGDPRWDDLRECMNMSEARPDRLEVVLPPWIRVGAK